MRNLEWPQKRRGIPASGLSLGSLGLVFAPALLALTAAMPSHAQSASDLVARAIENSPEVASLVRNREAVGHEIEQAHGLFRPQVDVDGLVGGEYANTGITRTSNSEGDINIRHEVGITLQQRIFDGYETKSTVEREQAREGSAYKRIGETVHAVALNAIRAHLEVYRQRRLLAIALENVEVHKFILDRVEESVSSGGGVLIAADTSQTEVRLARAEATVAETRSALRSTEAEYVNIVGDFPPENLSTMTVTPGSMPKSLEDAEDLVYLHNPATRIAEWDIEVAEAGVRLSEANFYPSLSVEGAARYVDEANGNDAYSATASVLLRARWNIYRGGIDSAARQEAVARSGQARADHRQASINAIRELRSTWSEMVASQDNLEIYARGLASSADTREQYWELFQTGGKTLLDLLDAENEYFVISGRLVTDEVNVAITTHRILAISGQLLDYLGVSDGVKIASVNSAADASVPSE